MRPGTSNDTRAELGRRAEALAARHLEQLGFSMLARNARLGRFELDIIARRGPLVVFCEVRSRSDDRFISPADTITSVKQQKLRQAATLWLRQAKLGNVEVRFDAVCVVFDVPEGRLTYYEGAFR
ncbi:MAG TPA: YraN family protein [Polyangiales bacterium]|nr:YraN family protein [Polyangiales bacterium]